MCNAKIGLSVDGGDLAYPVGMPEKYKKLYYSEILKRRTKNDEGTSDLLGSTVQSTRKFLFKIMEVWEKFTGSTFFK